MNKKFDTAVVIGRFQIPHSGHRKVFDEAAKLADRIVVIIGSVGQPSTPKNPFSFEERKSMLRSLLPDIPCDILPVRDQTYNIQNWIVDVNNKVNSTDPKGWTDYPPKRILVGHHKDESSFYLDMFPRWKFHEVESEMEIHATDIRQALFEGKSFDDFEFLNSHVKFYLQGWTLSDDFRRLQEEYQWLKEYKEKWGSGPFVTADAVVIQSGHILLVQRGDRPAIGQWALPGGFVNPKETVRQAALRELKEETRIKVQPIILDRNIKRSKVFDAPNRSQRGRIFTHAFLIELDATTLPRIQANDDAKDARWFPLNEVFSMGEVMFEDHLDIILNMTGGM